MNVYIKWVIYVEEILNFELSRTMNGDCRKQKLNPGHVWEKEEEWWDSGY